MRPSPGDGSLSTPKEATGTDGPGPRRRPVWAIAVELLGWLIVVATILAYAFVVIAVESAVRERLVPDDMGTITIFAGMGVWTAGFGGLLVIIGRSRRPNVVSTGLKLWAKFAIVVGIMLGLGMPLFLSGGLMYEAAKSTVTNEGGFVTACIVVGGASLLAGLAAIVSAVIWGRRRKPPDVSHVFT